MTDQTTFFLVIISMFLIILVSIQYTLNKILVELRDLKKNGIKTKDPNQGIKDIKDIL